MAKQMTHALRADGAVRSGIPPGPGRARLIAGVALVAGAAVVGLAAGRDSPGTSAWVVTRPVAANSALTQADIAPADVTLPDETQLWPGDSVPEGVARRTLGAGQPLMMGDVAVGAAPDTRSVSLTLPPERLPATVAVGDQVDVWVRAGATPQLLLPDVAVAAVQADPAVAAQAQVSVLVPAADAEPAVLAALADDVVLVRRS